MDFQTLEHKKSFIISLNSVINALFLLKERKKDHFMMMAYLKIINFKKIYQAIIARVLLPNKPNEVL